ncbi:MAG TPA: type II toxin-antitoxin system VapB family antitoxin [Trichormus sp.]|jgi:antitoxin VapB
MKRAKIFKNGQSQAVRLPKEFRFEGDEVYIKRTDEGVLLIPLNRVWDSFLKNLDEFSDDFMTQREQPTDPQERESLDA